MYATINKFKNKILLKYIIKRVESYIWLTNGRFGSFFAVKIKNKLKKCRDPPINLNFKTN